MQYCAQREACVLVAHVDSPEPGAPLAIGIGDNDPAVKPGDTISFPEAQRRYVEKFRTHAEADVDTVFKGVPLTPPQYDVIASMTYQIGGSQLRRETPLVDAVKRMGDQVLAPDPDPKEQAAKMRRLQDDAAAIFPQIRRKDDGGYHTLSRRSSDMTLFLRGDYGDLTFLKLYLVNPREFPDDFYRVKMPVFR